MGQCACELADGKSVLEEKVAWPSTAQTLPETDRSRLFGGGRRALFLGPDRRRSLSFRQHFPGCDSYLETVFSKIKVCCEKCSGI